MPAKFQLKDSHLAFCAAIAAGEKKGESFKKYMGNKKMSMSVAGVMASKLLKVPEIIAAIERATKAREEAILKAQIEALPPEFKTAALNVDQMDAFHYAVIKGEVQIEELLPIVTITKDKKGREISRTTQVHRVHRKPNVRERQASVDALYKRFGFYSPSKMLGAFGKIGDDGDIENVERFVLLSTGDKVPMFQGK